MARHTAAVILLAALSAWCVYSVIGQRQGPVTDLCLGCICEAVSNCNRSLGCDGNVCGLFRITRPYWTDSGMPVINGDSPVNPGAFERCVTEPFCAARAVQGYMQKYSQDCTGDGVIDCWDYAAMHRHGPYSCQQQLDYAFKKKFDDCQRSVAQLNQG